MKEISTLRRHNNTITALAFDHEGKHFVSGDQYGMLGIWDFRSKRCLKIKRVAYSVKCLKITHENLILLGGSEGSLSLFNFQGDKVREFQEPHGFDDESDFHHEDFAEDIYLGVDCSYDGKFIVGGGSAGIVKLWNKRGDLLRTSGYLGEIYCLAISKDNKLVLAGGSGQLNIWNTEDNKVKTLEVHSVSIRSLSFDNSSNKFVTGGKDGVIKLWNPQGRMLKRFLEHDNSVNCLKFSNDDKYIISGGGDAKINVWNSDAESPDFGKPIFTIAERINCKGMDIAGAKGLNVILEGYEVVDSHHKGIVRKGTLKDWLIERGAFAY